MTNRSIRIDSIFNLNEQKRQKLKICAIIGYNITNYTWQQCKLLYVKNEGEIVDAFALTDIRNYYRSDSNSRNAHAHYNTYVFVYGSQIQPEQNQNRIGKILKKNNNNRVDNFSFVTFYRFNT